MKAKASWLDSVAYNNTLDKGMDWMQVQTVAVSQSIRNELESFHGVFDDEHEGFIDDDQMMRLNICIRKAVHEALLKMELVNSFIKRIKADKPVNKAEQDAWDWFSFQCSTYSPEYMESPGSPELDKAYKKYVTGYKGVKRNG